MLLNAAVHLYLTIFIIIIIDSTCNDLVRLCHGELFFFLLASIASTKHYEKDDEEEQCGQGCELCPKMHLIIISFIALFVNFEISERFPLLL